MNDLAYYHSYIKKEGELLQRIHELELESERLKSKIADCRSENCRTKKYIKDFIDNGGIKPHRVGAFKALFLFELVKNRVVSFTVKQVSELSLISIGAAYRVKRKLKV